MTETTYLQFANLDHPVALIGARSLLPLISRVLARWPHSEIPEPTRPPFAAITATAPGQWTLGTIDAPTSERQWDDVNVLCDLVSEMAWELIRSDPDLLCLHAAAVDFDGCLVVMPNARRAGKSTLCAALSRLGHPLFTDDFLPVRLDPRDASPQGIATGVAPRVRLPLPAAFSPAFRDWVARDGGPSNAQYKYLVDSDVAPCGTALPLGAMVVLDRRDAPCDMVLEPMAREDALATLITQNFARQQHAAAILAAADKITQGLPIHRLTYHAGEAAAAFLSAHPALRQGQPARPSVQTDAVRQAPLAAEARQPRVPSDGPPNAPSGALSDAPFDPTRAPSPAPGFEPSGVYMQRTGVVETHVGGDHFLADDTGRTIHRLNPGSALIWRLLAEPSDLAEIVELVSALFEEIDPAKIRADSEAALRDLLGAGLITRHQASATAPSQL